MGVTPDRSKGPALTTTRLLVMYDQLAPPFEINSVFAPMGGVDFARDADDHYHFRTLALPTHRA